MGFLSSLEKLVLLADIFGQGIQLKINKKQKSKTLLGGLLSVLMFLTLCAFFYYNAQDVLYKTNPQISVEQQINTNYSDIILDKFTFPVSFSLTNFANYPIYKPNYFTYTAKLLYGLTVAENMNELHLNFTYCKKENFPLIDEVEYQDKNIDANFCFENQNLTINGSWSSVYLQYIRIQIAICQDKEECAPYDEIMEYLNSNALFWNIYVQNTYINPQNNESPISYKIANYYKSIRVGSFKLTEVYLRKQKLDSEEGFLFQTKSIKESTAYDKDLYDEGTLDDTLTLVEFSLMVSENNLIYHRSYMKIQSVLANVGGLSTVLNYVFLIMTYIFSVVLRNQTLLNTIFEFDMYSIFETDKKPLNLNIKKEIYYTKNFKNTLFDKNRKYEEKGALTDTIKILRDVSNPKNLFVKNTNDRKNFKNILSLNIQNYDKNKNSITKINSIVGKRIKENSISFSFFETISAFIICSCCRSNYIKNKRKLYDKGFETFEDFLDFTFIVKKIDEFDKLKMILLQKHQIALFNFITKQLISLDEEKMKSHEYTKLKSYYNNIGNISGIIQEYKNRLSSNQSEFSTMEVDNRLVNLLSEEYRLKLNS